MYVPLENAKYALDAPRNFTFFPNIIYNANVAQNVSRIQVAQFVQQCTKYAQVRTSKILHIINNFRSVKGISIPIFTFYEILISLKST